PFAVAAPLGFMLGIESEVDQGVVLFAGREDNVTPLAPIPAARVTSRHKLLPPEGHAAIPAVPRLDVNAGFVNEHEKCSCVPHARRHKNNLVANLPPSPPAAGVDPLRNQQRQKRRKSLSDFVGHPSGGPPLRSGGVPSGVFRLKLLL